MDALSIVLIIFVVIILILYFYRIYLNEKAYNKLHKWPPTNTPMSCPDYWYLHDGECINSHQLGNAEPGSKQTYSSNFNSNASQGCAIGNKRPLDSDCLRKINQWSQSTNNPWFGSSMNCSNSKNSSGSGSCYSN